MTEIAAVGPSIHSGEVTPPTLDFLLGLGNLAQVGSGEVSVDFEDHDAFELVTWLPGTHELGLTYPASDFGTPTVTFGGGSGSLQWSSVGLGTVTITYQAQHDTGELDLSVSYVPGITTFGMTAHAIRLLWRLPAKDEATLFFPQEDGRALYQPHRDQDPYDILNAARGGYNGNVSFLGSNTGNAALGYAHWYDEDTGSGVLWRLTGQRNRGVVFETEPQGDDGTLFSIYLIPDDNKLGSGASVTFSSALSIEPVAGDWWDGALRYALDLERESHPGLSRGLRSDPATTFPARAESVCLQMDITGTHGSADWSRAPIEVTRVRDYLATSDILVWTTNWHRHPQGELWPQWDPPEPGFAAAVAGIDGAGAYTVPYTYGDPVHPSTTEYTTSSPAWSGLIVRDSEQNPITTDLPASVAGPPDSVHHIFNPARVEARAAMLANWADLQVEIPGIRGAYFDTWPGGSGRDDHSSSLPASSRGNGSQAVFDGWLSTYEGMRDQYRANDSEFILLGEGHNESSSGIFDIVSIRAFRFDALQYAFVPAIDTIWAPYIRWTTFGSPSMGILGTANNVPLFAWFQALNFVRGIIPTLPTSLTVSPSRYLIPQSGEEGYTEFTSYESEVYDFAMQLFARSPGTFKPFDRGMRLRPLPGDILRTVAKTGFSLNVSALPTVQIDSPPILTSVSHTTEGGARIGIKLANWTDAEASFTINMTTADYPMIEGAYTTTLKTQADTMGVSWVPANDGLSGVVTLPARSWGLVEIHGVTLPSWYPCQ